MRVVIVTSFPEDTLSPHGGVEAVSVTLAKALARYDDLELHVVTMDRGRQHVACTTWGRIVVHRLPAHSHRMLEMVLFKDAARLREYVASLKPDVVHAHDLYGAMLRGLPVPRVFTVHGFIYADTLVSGGMLPRLRSHIWKWLEMRGWADQDRIISISPYVRERLSPVVNGVIHDIDNPVREDFFALPRQDAGGVIFTASVINQRKNVLALVEAVALLRGQGVDVTLRIAGPITDEAYGQSVREAIARHGLGNHVHLLGARPAPTIQQELTQASAFALVSLEENSPMGIEEAMAASVPVVTSNRCGMPYMVRDGDTGFLVNPYDARDIAESLRVLIQCPELRASMGRQGQAVARDRFHPDAVARRTRAASAL
jgi:glycosyltransferase involved in cell wall biosynthesis